MMESILRTAHIHLDNAVFRIHVQDADVFPINEMNDNKPDFVLWVGKSNDETQSKQSILCGVCEGYDLNELDEWINSYE